MKKYILVLIVLIFGLVGCKNRNEIESSKINIVVSIPPQEAFVKAVGKDFVNVTTMIPPGYSESNYQPRPKEIKALSNAQIYFSIGVNSERANILPKLKDFNKKIQLVKLDEIVDKHYKPLSLEHGHDHQSRDPHIWLSPKRVKVMINTIKEELIKIDPNHREYYEKNANDFIKELDNIDNEIKNTFKDVESRYFIMYHPAFGYFANDYKLKMIVIEEDGKEATAKRIKEVIDFAKEKNIRIIFYQEEYDRNQAETIAEEIGGTIIKVSPLSNDYLNNLKDISSKIKEALK